LLQEPISRADAELTVKELEKGRIAEAYPLVRASFSQASLADWQGYATAFLDAERAEAGGVVVVETRSRIMVALACYRVHRELPRHRTLCGAPLLLIGGGMIGSVVAVVATALERRARRAGCTKLCLVLDEGGAADLDADLSRRLLDEGLHLDGLRLTKPVQPLRML